MITFSHKGDFNKTFDFLKRNQKINIPALAQLGEQGVRALSDATPERTGTTASSWYYEIEDKNGTIKIAWLNSNIVDGVPIAIIIQYGHATGTGGYVEGIDYVNPAMRPLFEEIADKAWREVIRS